MRIELQWNEIEEKNCAIKWRVVGCGGVLG
jgi:hypothetical protein